MIATDIAKRLGISAQRVYVLASSPGFPRPIGTPTLSVFQRGDAAFDADAKAVKGCVGL